MSNNCACRPEEKNSVTNDQNIRLGGVEQPLRLVAFIDSAIGIGYHFVARVHHQNVKEITEIYKERWQIELFCMWIMQNLTIKTFLCATNNAVLTQG